MGERFLTIQMTASGAWMSAAGQISAVELTEVVSTWLAVGVAIEKTT